MALSIEELGLTLEELQDRVIDRICEASLKKLSYDSDGEEHHMPSSLRAQLQKEINERVDATINRIAAEHILPLPQNPVVRRPGQPADAAGVGG